MKKIKKLFSKFPKKNILSLIAVMAIVIASLFLFLLYKNGGFESMLSGSKTYISGIILFEGNNCLYCEKVDNFIKVNKIEDKVKFTRLEVFSNPKNTAILEDKAQICGISHSQIGVPLLWDGKGCIVGYIDIIKFFQEKTAKKQ